jgi:hypothetical protein
MRKILLIAILALPCIASEPDKLATAQAQIAVLQSEIARLLAESTKASALAAYSAHVEARRKSEGKAAACDLDARQEWVCPAEDPKKVDFKK